MLNFNNALYGDDFDATKGYLRILFRPSYAIQARELTQLQTSLQNQLGEFGSNVFSNGSRVLDAQLSYENQATSLMITDTSMDLGANIANLYKYFTIDQSVINLSDVAAIATSQGYLSNRNGVTGLTFVNGNATLKVVAVYPNTSTSPACVICQSMSGALLANNTTYSSSGISFTTITSGSVGVASYYSIGSGVFFINDLFVYVEQQSIVTSQFTNTPSIQVGLLIQESIVTSDTDQSLFDPASGTTNYNAPGADRYCVELMLATQPVATIASPNFINLATLTNGIISAQNTSSTYSIIDDTLAQRTYDEAGDFTVTPFAIQLRDHPTDTTKFQVGLDAGLAYVRGYEFQTISTTWLDVERARTVGGVVNNTIPTTYGNYVNCNIADTTNAGSLPVLIEDTIQLWGTSSQIGTAKVRMVYRTYGTQYQVYLTDINMLFGGTTTPFASVMSMRYPAVSGMAAVSWGVVQVSGVGAVLNNPSDNSLLFTQPYSNLGNPSSNSPTNTPTFTNTTFNYMKVFTIISALWVTSGVGVDATATASGISPNTGEQFIAPNDGSTFAPYIVINNASGMIEHITNVVVNSGGSVTITISDSGGGSVGDCTVYAPTFRGSSAPRTKTLNQNTISVNATTGITAYKLVSGTRNYYDIQSIVSIYSSAHPTVNLIGSFTLNGGQTDSYYDVGSIGWNSSATPPLTGETLTIIFNSFDHSNDGSGTGYFTIDSYTNITYANIPTYKSAITSTSYSLSDVIDFRPTINDAVGATTFKTQALPIPLGFGGEFIASYFYYLPRNDKLVLTKDKQFVISQGVPALKPITPADLPDAMTLYTLSIPAYTRSSSQVGNQYVENKRYTMRDIGSLDSRISRVEYYTALSLLEKQVQTTTVLDPSGNVAYKNGISVDAFAGHSIGDVAHPEYKCSIDYINQVLRPKFVSRSYSNSYVSGGSLSAANVITLPYTPITYIDQPLASSTMSITPYNTSNWVGSATLSPSSDIWYDQSQTPVVVQNVAGSNNNWLVEGANAAGTVWDGWTTDWLGTKTITALSAALLTSPTINTNTRTGINTSVISMGMNKIIGDRSINTTVVQFMRQIPISFNASGLKPFTTVYAYFDSIPVDVGATLVTDAAGSVSGTFTIPAGVKTGTRLFLLSDSTPNNPTATTSVFVPFNSSGEYTTLSSKGLVQTPSLSSPQQINASSASPITYPVGDSTGASVRFPVDPLAESFTVSAVQYPNGIFLDSIDIYFSAKSSTLPVSLHIRPMVNGFPSVTNIVPLSEVVLQASSVNIAANLYNPQPTDKTRFQFKSPVRLSAGDYCFTLSSTSSDYKIFVGTIGDSQYSSNNIISKQPKVGSMFKSQSASAWSASSDTDIMFKLNQCSFSSSAIVTLTNELNSYSDIFHYSLMNVNPASTEFSTAAITWNKQGIPVSGVLESISAINSGVNLKLAQLYQIQGTNPNQLEYQATLTTSDSNISPIIELDRCNTVVVGNVINNITSITNENLYNQGNALSKYISQAVTLGGGFESTGLNVTFDAYLPGIADVYVYYKSANIGNQVNFIDMGWTLLSGTSGSVQSNANRLDADVSYTTYSFTTPTSIPSYNLFSVKLVMVGDELNVPNIKDLQIISFS